jgi:hypothetical protein
MKSPWIHDCNIGHVHIAWMEQIDCPLCAALKTTERSKTVRSKRPVQQAKVEKPTNLHRWNEIIQKM